MKLAFNIDDVVELVVGRDIVGVVIAYMVRANEHVLYEVQWVHEGDLRQGWFIASELRRHDGKQRGF